MRIVFFGTPDFATASLAALLDAGFDVVAVVTATDKLGGRGGKTLIESDLKIFAQKKGLDILQPPNLKSPSFLDILASYRADVQVVVAFRMLPQVVWAMPPFGTINLHGSLLPKYRGAAPIHWAVRKGEKQTGLTTFRLKHQIDTGDILLQDTCSIGPNETTGQLYQRMMHLGAKLLVKTLKGLEDGSLTGQAQDESQSCPAPKLFRANTRIDWQGSAQEVHNTIRGLNPFPSAWTEWHAEQLKIHSSLLYTEPLPEGLAPGQAWRLDKKRLCIACGQGAIEVLELQAAKRKKQTALDFLNANSEEEHFFFR